MKTKAVVLVMVELGHPDGTKLRKAHISRYVKDALEKYESLQDEGMLINKAVVRSVDLD